MAFAELTRGLFGTVSLRRQEASRLREDRKSAEKVTTAEQCGKYGGQQATYLYERTRGAVIEPIPEIVHVGGRMRVLLSFSGERLVVDSFDEHMRQISAAIDMMGRGESIAVMTDPLEGNFQPLSLRASEDDLNYALTQREGSLVTHQFLRLLTPLTVPTVTDIYKVLKRV